MHPQATHEDPGQGHSGHRAQGSCAGRRSQGLLALARRLYRQKRHDKGKFYSVHAPEVECISKGKAHKRYEFGSKVALAVSSKGGWVLAAQALEGNPTTATPSKAPWIGSSRRMERNPSTFIARWATGATTTRENARFSCGPPEAGIDRQEPVALDEAAGGDRAFHRPSLKEDRRMERCRLKGTLGEKVNAVLSAAGMNFSKLLAALGALLSFLLDRRLLERPTS